jgi:hypothetical protein
MLVLVTEHDDLAQEAYSSWDISISMLQMGNTYT